MEKNYKNLNFNKKDDYLYALYVLVSGSYKVLQRYKRYQDELSDYLYDLEVRKLQYIDTVICEEWQDKMLSVSHTLLKFFVDDTKTGFSYVMFRRLINKTEYKLEPLRSDLEQMLNELRDVRNWSFHLPQTDFVAIKEVWLKSIPEEFHQYIEYNFNPIIIEMPDKTNKEFLQSLFLHVSKRIDVFEALFSAMTKDFETLLGEEIVIKEQEGTPAELFDATTAAIQLSMAMNKKKYDGSDEQYKKITEFRSKV